MGFPFFANMAPSMYGYFVQSNFSGKVIVVVLCLLSILSWTLLLGKYWQLRKFEIDNGAFEFALKEGKFLQQESPYHFMWKIKCKEALLSQNALDSAFEKQCIRYESLMVLMGSVVSVAPLLGLLGTVWGLMDAFGAVAMEQNASIQTLAPGVAGALLTTIVGLLVAIPMTVGYNLLSSKIKQMESDLQHFSDRLSGNV